MELSDIKKSISDMDDNELRELLTNIRNSRRTSKKPPAAAKKASKPKSEASAETLMKNMNANQAAQLLKLMEGMK